jgi:hypothetical protein
MSEQWVFGANDNDWVGWGTAVLLLGINKQLDLQTPLRDIGRAMAAAEGW